MTGLYLSGVLTGAFAVALLALYLALPAIVRRAPRGRR